MSEHQKIIEEHQKIIEEMETEIFDYQEKIIKQYAFLVKLNKENQHLHDFNGVLIETLEPIIKEIEYYHRLHKAHKYFGIGTSFTTPECKHNYDWIYYPEDNKMKYKCKHCNCEKDIQLH